MTTSPVPGPLLLRNVRIGLRGPYSDVLVADGVVAATGPAGSGIGQPGSRQATEMDGRGGTLLPGLRDRHVHMTQWAIGLQRTDLSGADSAAAAVDLIVGGARQDSEVLWGKNFRDGLWPDRPHKDLLEAAVPGRAVALVSNDLHSIWLSPAALALIGVDHPTGLLQEAAAFAALRDLPQAPDEVVDGWVREAAQLAAARGVTQILDFEFVDTQQVWRRRASGGILSLRVEAAIYRPLLTAVIAAGGSTGQVVDDTSGLVTVGPCKVLIDGSLNTRTAFCSAAYPGGDRHGLLTEDLSRLTEQLRTAARHGITFAVHAIGDAANHLALNCFRDAGVGGRIEHAQQLDAADFGRFAALGVVASVQPGHAPEDRDIADTHWAGHTHGAFAYAGLLAAGATLEFGSDAPVTRLDPWHAIAAAVHRTVDERSPWHPEQRVTIDQAVAASAGGRTAPTVGDVADLVLTADDPTTVDRIGLSTMPVLLTTVGGRITHHGAEILTVPASARA